jgi:hypothetical protein
MRADEIAKFSGQVIDKATLESIKDSENVKVIKDCGIDGRHLGKKWYVVVFTDGTEISVYTRR